MSNSTKQWAKPVLNRLGTIADVANANSGPNNQTVCSGPGGSLCKS